MLSLPPSAIQVQIDRWLEQRGSSTSGWHLLPVSSSGRSVAQVWHLVPQMESLLVELNPEFRGPVELGFAIRRWGRPIEDRASIEKILFFQKAAHVGLMETTSTWSSNTDDSGCRSIVPEVLEWSDQNSCIENASSIWTIETWRPGSPLEPATIVPESLLHQAFEVLERLHATGRQLGQKSMVAPGIVERSRRLAEWSSTALKSSWNQSIVRFEERLLKMMAVDQLKSMLDRTVDHLGRHASSLRLRLQHWLSSPVPCHWIVRDLWRENILIDCERISGIIDFGAAREDWPSLESVRWLSSWLSPDDPRVSKLLRGYEMLAEEDYRFFDHLATLLSLLQWFDWLLNANISIVGREYQTCVRMIELDRRLAHFDTTR